MRSFNLSEWALRHRSFMWFLMAISLVFGTVSYLNLGREEDPSFAIKTMIISAALPGATVEETLTQVTDRIEARLKDLPSFEESRSVTRAGLSVVFLDVEDSTDPSDLPLIWQDVRFMMADIASEFPEGFAGFQFNDDFGDVFGNIYAFTSDGFTPRELHDHVREVQRQVQALEDAGKVEIFGARDEVIYLEFSTDRLAALGLDQEVVRATLQAQNAILPSGVIDAGPERVMVRVGGQFADEQSLVDVNLRVGDQFFRLSDVAEIERGYADPPAELFRHNGADAVGLAVGMRPGGNVVEFGAEVDRIMQAALTELPVGITIDQVANQPHVVEESVNHFVRALAEAVIIVLAVSFLSLGLRAGLVIAVAIPIVLAITFVVMEVFGITLQRISLGALIIALGLLVDDAMIATETMISRMERGESRTAAASYAWTSVAFPMLSGTLVTVAGFLPIGANPSAAGEFTFSLFVVIAVALLVSWVVAVLFTPLLGVLLLPAHMKTHDGEPGRVRGAYLRVLQWAMRFRWVTIGATVGLFGLAVSSMGLLQNQFFPTSDRPELIVDVTLPQNASFAETQRQMDRIDALLVDDEDVLFHSTYVGRGAPRFLLSFDPVTPAANVGQVVIQTESLEARDRLKARLESIFATDFVGVDAYVKRLEIGPPVGRPIEYRLSGPDPQVVRDNARGLVTILGQDPRLTSIVTDWSEPSRVVRVDIIQDKARQLGVTAPDIASALNQIYAGATLTQLRDSVYLIDIVARGNDMARTSVEALETLQIEGPGDATIPLGAIATFAYELEEPVVRTRNRVPTINARAAISTDDQPATIAADLAPRIAEYEATLPVGYAVEVGGTVETSAESQGPIVAIVPLMLAVMVLLTMIQMQGFRLTLVVVSAAPLALVGVVAALLPSGAPLGFVAILGVLALLGIMIRNSIVLVHQIETLRLVGAAPWDAVVEAASIRVRPIILTAAAASLALIPISWQVFWGPMAYAMMGGIIVGTAITLLFIPALYCAVFRVQPPTSERNTDATGERRSGSQDRPTPLLAARTAAEATS